MLTLSQILPLQLLNRGEEGRILDVAGDELLVNRLHEMGLRSGATLRMVQPGRPCIVALADQRLSLRADDDLQVLVEMVESALAAKSA